MTTPPFAQITTLIPTYRRPRLLRRAILSAVQQESASVLVSVFDNCSGDDTPDVVLGLSQHHPQIRYMTHPTNVGSFANFARALRSVETPYFSILSDDDYLLPGFYRQALAGLSKDPDAAFWAGTTLHVDENGTIWDARVDKWAREGVFHPPEGVLAMTGGRAPTWTGVVFRREVLEQSGLPDPAVLGPSDLDFMLRLGARHSFVLEKFPAAVFTLNIESFSATQPLSSFWPGWQRMIQNAGKLNTIDDVVRHRLVMMLNNDAKRMLFRRGANAIASGRLDFARGAADALSNHYGLRGRAAVLRVLALACSEVPLCQSLLSGAYRSVESLLVRSRNELQTRFSHLLVQP